MLAAPPIAAEWTSFIPNICFCVQSSPSPFGSHPSGHAWQSPPKKRNCPPGQRGSVVVVAELEPRVAEVSEIPEGFAVEGKVGAVVVEVVVEVRRLLVVIRVVVAVVVVCSWLQ